MKNALPSLSVARNDIELFNITENSKLTVRITDIRDKFYQQVILSRVSSDEVKVVYREYSGSVHRATFSLRNCRLTLDWLVSSDVQFNNLLIRGVATDILIILRSKRSTKYMKVTRTQKDRQRTQ